ncbi:glycine cleavage system T protein [Auriculariales sp. MPI-PUGE-AT-0066]|nr:glycine cleavage system T protein [Auriculariales sp. MPI-PUGE-AT-0066]
MQALRCALAHTRVRAARPHARAFGTSMARLQELRKTGLYDMHVTNGGKMIPFAGYSMPLLYDPIGATDSHNYVRKKVGLFDVGHMVQSMFRGVSVGKFLEYLTPSSLRALPSHGSTLSVLLNPTGGIIDDTVITKHNRDSFYVVTNAGRRDEDLKWFAERLEQWNAEQGERHKVSHQVLEDYGLVALQGPEAAAHLQTLVDDDLSKLLFGHSAFMKLKGIRVHVARGGYTGEDGFEISIRPPHTEFIASLLATGPAQWTGLGARDSLRLEAGMCLYGHDLDETIGPVEAGLSWVIGKERREPGAAPFIGAETVLKTLKEGPAKRRIGLVVEGAPAREGMRIFDAEGTKELGVVTSGIPSPTLGKNIAMGYILNGSHKKNTPISVEVRKKMRPAVVTPMPFVPAKYYRG